jgi:hypothetical protein
MTPRFVATVDVEDFFLPRPPVDTYRAVIDGRGYGTPLIMDLLEEQDGRGTFFVDVCNRTTVDETLIADTLREIDARGHEVGLHTHPSFPEGMRGYGMAQTMRALTYEKQLEFIREGVEHIERVIGKRPVSHRAGGYGANRNTLRALAAEKFGIDSSLLYGYPYCDLNSSLMSINRPLMAEGLLEIPVTVTRCELALGSAKSALQLLAMTKKLDPDWCSPGELLRQVAALHQSQCDTIVLFLHSYSFLDVERGFAPKRKAIEKFRQFLTSLRSTYGGRFITIAEAGASIAMESAATAAPSPEVLPVVRSDLLWTHRELTFWLFRQARLRHLRLLRVLAKAS